MHKKVLSLLLILCMLVGVAPISLGATSADTVIVQDATVTAGNTAGVTVRAENFSDVASFDIYIYYDPDVFTVDKTSGGGMLSSVQASVNTQIKGTVKLSAISLDGISGTGDLLTIYLKTQPNAAPGEYDIRVAVGDAYDTNLNPAGISSVDGSVKVNASAYVETFSVYGYSDKSVVAKGDVLSYQLQGSNSRPFVSGDFIVEYDHEIFEFVSAELDDALKTTDAMYSVNSSVPGQVRIAYAATSTKKASYLFTLNLRVLVDKDGQTTIKAQSVNMCKDDLGVYLPGNCSNTITLKKQSEEIDYPDLFIKADDFVAGKQCGSTLYLEKGAGVAAGDFSIKYDTSVFRCVSVKASAQISHYGGMIVVNNNFSEGTIRFSYVNMEAYDETDVPLVDIVWEPLKSPSDHYEMKLSGVGVVDTLQKPVALEYVKNSGCIYISEVIHPNCTNDGKTTYTCICGNSYDGEIVDKLGHEIVSHEAREATCVEYGHLAYDECSRCDYTTYMRIPMIDHAYKNGKCTMCGRLDSETLLGDVDGDGKINMLDSFKLKLIIKQLVETTEQDIIASDIDCNGMVNMIDSFELKYRIKFGVWRGKEE